MKSITRRNPHPEYKGLLRQFHAACNLADSLQGQLTYYQQKDYTYSQARIEQLERELESQREVIETLTNEVTHGL